MFYTERFDGELARIEHYQKYPEMMPFIGNMYGKNKFAKILLIAESHYLPSKSTIHSDYSTWYSSSSNDLNTEERVWIHTRLIVDSGKNQHWASKGHTIFRNVEHGLLEAGFPKVENMFSYVSFMNCFQRPANEGKSIKSMWASNSDAQKIDTQKAKNTINDVLSIIEPQFVCFISSFASCMLGGTIDSRIHTKFTSHPSCQWWNRKSSRGTGKQVFINFVKQAL